MIVLPERARITSAAAVASPSEPRRSAVANCSAMARSIGASAASLSPASSARRDIAWPMRDSAVAEQFAMALRRGSLGDAKSAAEVMRARSGSTIIPRRR